MRHAAEMRGLQGRLLLLAKAPKSPLESAQGGLQGGRCADEVVKLGDNLDIESETRGVVVVVESDEVVGATDGVEVGEEGGESWVARCKWL